MARCTDYGRFCSVCSSGNAATLALSEASAVFTQFSLIPESQEVFTKTDTKTIATDGEVSANSDAEAVFLQHLPQPVIFPSVKWREMGRNIVELHPVRLRC